MKKFLKFFFAGILSLLIFSACKDDEPNNQVCYDCQFTFIVTAVSEFCDDGTNMTTVTNSVVGFPGSSDTIVNVTAMQYATSLEASGFTCTMK